MISAGQLNYRVQILTPTTTVDSTGQQKTTWATLCTTRANLIQQKGNRSMTGGEIWDAGQIAVILRYRTGITFRCRVKRLDTNEVYAITNIATDRTAGSITIQAVALDIVESTQSSGTGSGGTIPPMIEI